MAEELGEMIEPIGPYTEKVLTYLEQKGERVYHDYEPESEVSLSMRIDIGMYHTTMPLVAEKYDVPLEWWPAWAAHRKYYKGGDCFIVVNNTRCNDEALAWTLLHEWGHHVLDHWRPSHRTLELEASAWGYMVGKWLGIPLSKHSLKADMEIINANNP